MDIIKEITAPKLTLDEVLAIDPTFTETVEAASDIASVQMEKAETLTKEAQSKLLTANNLRTKAARVIAAVGKFRKISGSN